MRTHVTIKEVAREAHVSVATVSRVFAGGTASEASRDAVTKAAQKLHYVPNGVARSLRVQRQGVVAALVSDVRNPYFGLLAHALQTELAENDLVMILGNASEDYQKQEEFLEKALEHRVDGMVLAIHSKKSPALDKILARGVPVVFVDRAAPNYDVPYVGSEAASGIRAALTYLKEQGHRRIALVSGIEDTSTVRERQEAFEKIGTELGLATGVNAKGATPAQLYEEWVNSDATAVLFAYAPNMWPVLQYLSRKGVKIPNDLSVIGYDDLPIMEHLHPPLTTIGQEVAEMSRRAVKILVDLLENKQVKGSRIPTKLIVRKSTGKPRKGALSK
ncbi:MAG: LacI family DNA-binding transcriptional regulator [Actinomycetaceae bacterium]|nr:LacI family DNA-binding transcriptional regulator [Actinomycetaceae bacterium]